MAERTFTPSEANSALERVQPLAERMVELAARATALAQGRGAGSIASGNGKHVGSADSEPDATATLAALDRCLRDLAALGVEVKDVDSGLVDFPSVRHGEPVLLCWRVGEPAVEWWHRREEGFAGRRRIDWDEVG